MNKNIFSKTLSTISTAMLVVGLAVPAFSTNAATSTFNDASNDLKTLRVANSTKSAGTYSWAATAIADGNDSVAFLVYYHNTSTTTANNAKVRVNLPTTASKNQKISVNLWADNATSIYDFVTLDISTSQTLTLIPGSVKWYPNQGSAAQALPLGQTGDEIISFNGLNIGNINGGWTTQGYITLKAQVSNNSATAAYAPSATTYSATNIATTSATLSGIINPNSASTNTWFEYGTSATSFTNSTTAQNMGTGASAVSASANLTGLTANTTYYFRAVAQNSQGTTNGSVLSFTTNLAGNTNTNTGSTGVGTAQFNNDSKDSKTIQISNSTKSAGSFNWAASTTADGNDIVAILVYYHNTSGNVANNTKIRVNIPSANSKSQTVSTNLWADNATSIYDFATLNISTSQNITFIPGSVKWYPNQGSAAQALPSGQTGDEIISFNGLNIGNINGGWTTQGYITLKAQVSNNSSVIAMAPTVTTYAATNIASTTAALNSLVNPNSASTNTWFEYGTSATSFTNSTTAQNMGTGASAVSVSANLTGLTANTTYYFRAVAQNSQGTTNGSVLSFTTSTTINPTALAPTATTYSATNITTTSATVNGQANPNNASTIIWFEYGASANALTFATATQSLGSGSAIQNISANLTGLASNTTYYFRAVAQNSAGTSYGATLSFTTSASSTTTSAPSAITNSATSISTNSATLNATINPNGASTTAWFEYGTSSSSLTYATSTQSLGSGASSTSVTSNISSLSSNTTYYFRAVAQNSQGTTYGSTLSFSTSSSGGSGGGSLFYSAPSVTTYSATSISSNSASFSGLVNPNNVSTNGWFEYGASSNPFSYTTSVQGLGSGSSSVSLGATVSGLSANTIYYYRAAAQNSYGTVYGGTLSLTTAAVSTSSTVPSVTANAATSITSNSAKLNSTINPNGYTTTASFEYGTSSYLLDKTSLSYEISGSSYVPVTIGISGLSANTTYYFRPVAKNSTGTTYGATNSFTTSSTTAATTITTTATTQKASTTTAINSNYPNKPYIDIVNGLTVENLTSPNGNGTANFANIGDKLKYTIAIRNTGGTTGYGIKVSDQFSSVLKYIESSPKADFDSVANVVSWNIAKLSPAESQVMSFIVEVQGGLNTTVDNQAKEYLSFANLNAYSNTVSTFIIKQKPISIKLDVDKTEVKSGEILNYSLTIKNANDYNLSNFLLSIGLPENVELQEADFTVFNKSEKSMVINLGEVAAGQEIVRKLSVKVTDQAKEGDILTLIAIANYQDAAGNTQPIVSALISTTVIGSFNLMASIFGGIKSLSGMDWVILFGSLIAILGGSFAIRKLYKRYKTVKVRIQQG